ncbi:MAG: response regulator transcription factor [Chloroflexota bacterium]|nr:MAG: DNA-binding response regulator [Chloroflexota bacterium]
MNFEDVRVFIVAENPLARAGLAALLEKQPGLQITGQSAPDVGLADTLSVFGSDVVIWDLGWDPQQGLEIVAEQRDTLPPIVALLSEADVAPDALASGVRGVLLQESSPEALSAAARAVAAGLIVAAPETARFDMDERVEGIHPPVDTLTPRELEVLNLMAEGLPNKTIAARLGISDHTVKFHVNAIMTKLGAQSRTDAVVRATRLGLIAL